MLVVSVLIATALVVARRRKDDIGVTVAVGAALTLVFGTALWAEPYAFARNLAPLMVLGMLVIVRSAPTGWRTVVMIAPLILTVLMPLPGGVFGGL